LAPHLRSGSELAIGAEETVDVVAMEVRNDHGVDRLGVDAGSRKISVELTHGALALLVNAQTEAGVHHHQLGTRVHDDGRERVHGLFLVYSHVHRCKPTAHDILLLIAYEVVGQRRGTHAIGDDRDFKAADLVAIPARRLLAGKRRCGIRRRWPHSWAQHGCGCRCGADEHAATCKL
jgi:hypothetical protein